MKIIVALGNPGNQYKNTRHNIGWLLLDKLNFSNRLVWKNKFKAEVAEYSFDGDKIIFLKPQTFMNLSGESLSPCMKFYKVSVDDILVIHDELDLPFGTIAFKNGGGLAGHNGLKSINQHLGTQAFKRLRMGIGRPVHGNVSSYVLSNFDGEEEKWFDNYMEECGKALDLFLEKGFDKAATSFSKKALINL